MQGKSLGEAKRLFRARKFPDVIRFLEPEVFRFRESIDYFLLLGLSCLRTGDLGGAFSYLGRARQLDGGNVKAALGLAAIHVRRAETEKALALWLEVLESEPSNAVARRGMEILRRGLAPDQLQELVDSSRINRLYPPLPPRITVVPFVVGILVALIAVGLGYIGYRVIPFPPPARRGIAEVEIPNNLPRLIENGAADSSSPYTLTERQVLRGFEQAKRDLLSSRDNLAAVEINRILLSNASLPVKERVRILKGFVEKPSFTTFRDGFSYRDVAKDPPLYDGASVLWKGLVANLSVGKDAIRFDFLVGYDQKKELEGIVPVSLSFAAELQNGMPLEVLARVSSEDGRLALDGISLHKLVPQ